MSISVYYKPAVAIGGQLSAKTISSNGVYNAGSEGVYGYSQVTVSVPGPVLISKTISVNGSYSAVDDNAEGYSHVDVNVPDTGKLLIEGGFSEISNSEATRIRDYAFANCYALTSISFPNCTYIGSYAFSGCSSLTEANFPNCKYIEFAAFQSCIFLTEANFPNCFRVGGGAFYSCYSLSSINFPNCIEIGTNAFTNCFSLKTVEFSNCQLIEYGILYACSHLERVSLPKCFEIKSNYAFAACSSLSLVSIPNCVKTGGYTFSSCLALTEANFPNCMSIGSDTFRGCYSLFEANFPNCSYIGQNAFYSCSSLTKANFLGCVSIGGSAFYNCSSLSSVTIMNMSTIATQLSNSQAFQGTPMMTSSFLGYFGSIFVHPDRVEIYKSATNWAYYSDRIVAAPSELVNKGIWPYEYYNRSDLTEVPSEKANAEIIGTHAFQYCYSLSSISLPNCTNIGAFTFTNCTRLSLISFPNCEFIGEDAFGYCTSLTEVNFPKCKYIGRTAFLSCRILASVNFPNCMFISEYAFQSCSASLTSVNFPNCTYIGNYVFQQCSALTEAYFYNCLYIDEGAFSNCTALRRIYLPNCMEIKRSVFYQCRSLSSVNSPNCMIIRQGAFYSCYSLPLVSFPNCLSIEQYVFSSCIRLSQAYFLASVVPTLSNSNAFYSTPMSNSGSIYVRASLLSQYQVAPNWSYFSERFVGVNNIYSTSASITNGSCDFDYDEVAENTTIEAHIVPDDGYSYPDSVIVTGATSSYDSTTGTITISNPTDTIVVSAECGAAVPPVDPVLGNNSWDVIKAVCEAGEAANYWAVGDTKTDVGTDGNTRTFQIVDMSGLYGKHVVFEQVELESTDYQWNPSDNTDSDNAYNNYSISDMRITHLPAIMAKYSSELQTNLTNTTYKVAQNGTSATILDLTDKLFLPAEKEVFGSANYSRSEEATALSHYQYYATNTAASYKQKTQIGGSSPSIWWLRSPRSSYVASVCFVYSDGNANYNAASYSFGTAPCFSF